MGSVEERVAFVEGKVEEHSRMLDGIREAVVHLERRMDRRFESIDRRFESIDRRFESIDRRFESIDGRFQSLEQTVDQKFTLLEQRMIDQFRWLVGIQVTTLAAIVAALVAR